MENTDQEVNQDTLNDIYDQIADMLAIGRAKALMGLKEEAASLFQSAFERYWKFYQALREVPGIGALDHAYSITVNALNQINEETEKPFVNPIRKGKKRR